LNSLNSEKLQADFRSVEGLPAEPREHFRANASEEGTAMRGPGFGLVALLALGIQAGCTTLPPEGSLERMKLDGQRQAAKDCYRINSRAYPKLPMMDVWNGCWRAYGHVNAQPQPVTF
jgi:hypothetical protein